jgi:hypothetical protein
MIQTLFKFIFFLFIKKYFLKNSTFDIWLLSRIFLWSYLERILVKLAFLFSNILFYYYLTLVCFAKFFFWNSIFFIRVDSIFFSQWNWLFFQFYNLTLYYWPLRFVFFFWLCFFYEVIISRDNRVNWGWLMFFFQYFFYWTLVFFARYFFWESIFFILISCRG